MNSEREDSEKINLESTNSIQNTEQSDTNAEEEEEYKKFCCFKISNDSDEQKRLGSYPALQTLMKQSLGPLCSQVVTSMYLIVDSFWVSHTIGADGLTATGAVSLLEAINNSFGLYLLSCVSARISYLFGQKRNEECAQVFVDILRVSWIFSVILPIIMLNICKPLTKWFGADEHIQEMGFQYLIPITGLTVFYETYQICCGLLQSEGLSWIYGICQVCSLLLNMVCLDPLFLIAFKTPIWGASLASIIASFLPMTVLMILIFKGKFTVKPNLKMFCKNFSPETKSALKLGLSTLVELLSGNLPDVIIQKWLGNSGNAIGQYNEVISAWNILLRVYMFVLGINNGIAQGLLPSASFAFGAKRLKRFRNLVLHAIWIGTVWNVVCDVIVMTNARSISKIWLKEEKFLNLAEKFFRNCFFTIALIMFKFASITALQASKKIVISIVVSIVTLLIPIPLFSTILYVTDKNNPTRLVYAFPMTDGLSFVICFITLFAVLRFLCKKNPDLEKDKIFGVDNIDDNEPNYYSDDENVNKSNEEIDDPNEI